MKKIFFILSAVLSLFGCNSNTYKKAESAESITQEHHDSATLTLNNGAKWNADSITNHNVVNLKTITDNFRIKPFPSITEYQLLSTDLSNSLNTMIQECKMTGPDHEALHHWLEPVLNNTKELKNVTDTSAGRAIFESLDKEIQSYQTYFE